MTNDNWWPERGDTVFTTELDPGATDSRKRVLDVRVKWVGTVEKGLPPAMMTSGALKGVTPDGRHVELIAARDRIFRTAEAAGKSLHDPPKLLNRLGF